MSNITQRIKELLKENNVTQNEFATAIGYSQRAVSKWINGQAEPTATAIMLCAQYFNVSTDYLLGITEEYFN